MNINYLWEKRKHPLSLEEIRSIREQYQQGITRYQLAKEYKVCWSTIQNVVNYRRRYQR